MPSGHLTDIHISSGVNDKFEGFCTISINHGDLLGQLTPAEVRAMALQWLEVAEGAETDSILFRLLRGNLDLDLNTIGAFVAEVRKMRAAE